jgi:hypothetical protein
VRVEPRTPHVSEVDVFNPRACRDRDSTLLLSFLFGVIAVRRFPVLAMYSIHYNYIYLFICNKILSYILILISTPHVSNLRIGSG